MKIDFDKVIERQNTNSVKWDETENRFGEKDLLPMWVADMDFEVAEPITKAIQERATHPVYGYNTVGDSTYEAIIEWMKTRHHWDVEKDWIVMSPGVVPALSSIINAFTEPGDPIIVQPPVYYPFFGMVEQNKRTVVENELIYKNGRYEMDFDDLEEKLKSMDIKMLILSNPHNPVGRVWTKDELQKLGDLCVKHDVIIVSDDIHFDLIFPGYEHTLLASLSEEFAQQTITCTAPSKTFNLAALQTSTIMIPNEKYRNTFKEYLMSQGIMMSNAFGPVALEAAYRYGGEWLDQLNEYLKGNLDYLKDFFKERLPDIDVIEPEGTYLIWMDFRKLGLDYKELEQLMLKEAKIALDEGYIFGEAGKGFERINIACPRSILKDGLERIEKAVNTLR